MFQTSYELFEAKEKIYGKENYSENASRMHRAISWLYACEENINDDLAFLSAWIGFNSCYSVPPKSAGEKEYDRISDFLADIIRMDRSNLITSYVFEEQVGLIDSLMNNQYLFRNFWISIHSQEEGWEQEYNSINAQIQKHRDVKNTLDHCNDILKRVYVLRNQLIHGAATYESSMNRDQMEICMIFMRGFLLRIINVMIANPRKDWGQINYPPLP
jgi:hypothetical protein